MCLSYKKVMSLATVCALSFIPAQAKAARMELHFLGFWTVHLSPADMDTICVGSVVVGNIPHPIAVGIAVVAASLCEMDRATGHRGLHLTGHLTTGTAFIPFPGE
jgi:hypothetical protein